MFRARTAGSTMLGILAAVPLLMPNWSAAYRQPSSHAAVAVATPQPGSEYHPAIDPAAFVFTIDNPYLPLQPGATFTWQGTKDGEPQTNVTEVSHDTKVILGVTTTVVRDTVTTPQGELIEQTLDWYAQDKNGNVWYFGEDSKDYENGQVVSTEGSWEAGVDGAQPGIVVEGQPTAGDSYRQEYSKGVAEDMATVLGLAESVTVPYGSFANALLTEESTALEPDFLEHKYYVQGIGMVRSVAVKGGPEEFVLVDFKPGQASAPIPVAPAPATQGPAVQMPAVQLPAGS